VFLGLVGLFVIPYVRRVIAREKAVLKAHEESLEYGLYRPASLHPVVNPDQCIGTGNCVEVCPEKDVLGLLSGQAMPVSPSRCVGHGLCERSCPVNAIELVFGTSKRGIDLPRIQENFETNVPGLFVVGELGGMGLIRNAFEQGRQCIELMHIEKDAADPDVLDIAIIGCGPAGLSCALFSSEKGYSYVFARSSLHLWQSPCFERASNCAPPQGRQRKWSTTRKCGPCTRRRRADYDTDAECHCELHTPFGEVCKRNDV